MRARDLIPRFMDAMKSVDPDQCIVIRDEFKAVFAILDAGGDPEDDSTVDDCYYLMNEALIDDLGERCLPFFYFGSNEGDGADYGVWFSREAFDNAVEDGAVLKTDAGSDWHPLIIDAPDAEYVAEVNDRGNITLFNAQTKQEIWAIA